MTMTTNHLDAEDFFGPNPTLFGGRRPRLMLMSSNDNERRRAMRQAFKGIVPRRRAAAPQERSWRAESRRVSS